MKIIWLLLFFVGIQSFQFPAQRAQAHNRPEVSGILVFHQLESKIFKNKRTLRVLLPKGYFTNTLEKFAKKTKIWENVFNVVKMAMPCMRLGSPTPFENRNMRYPVLYMNDGQNLFDSKTTLYNTMEWGVDETVDRLLNKGEIKPLIIVGIDNAGKKMRPYEYLPWEDIYLKPACPNPQGKKYPDFLVKEVMPFINKKYRTLTGTAYTGLGGSSYGALITLYCAMAKPGVFGYLMIESPSLYVSDKAILGKAAAFSKWPEKIYIGVGTNEEGRKNCDRNDFSSEAVRDVFELERILKKAGFTAQRLKVNIDICATHNEEAFGRRFPVALKFLFGK